MESPDTGALNLLEVPVTPDSSVVVLNCSSYIWDASRRRLSAKSALDAVPLAD